MWALLPILRSTYNVHFNHYHATRAGALLELLAIGRSGFYACQDEEGKVDFFPVGEIERMQLREADPPENWVPHVPFDYPEKWPPIPGP